MEVDTDLSPRALKQNWCRAALQILLMGQNIQILGKNIAQNLALFGAGPGRVISSLTLDVLSEAGVDRLGDVFPGILGPLAENVEEALDWLDVVRSIQGQGVLDRPLLEFVSP